MQDKTRTRALRRGLALGTVGVLGGGLFAYASSPASAAVPIEVRIGDATSDEGNGPTPSKATFNLSLSATAGVDTYVYYHTVDGTASAKTKTNPGGDFANKAINMAKAKIAAGKTTAAVGIAIYPDANVEGDETFSIVIDKVTTTLGGPNNPGYTVKKGTGAGIIRNDDPAPATRTVKVGDVAVPEGNVTPNPMAKLAVSMSAIAPTDQYVYFHTTDGTATAPGDYLSKPATTKVKIAAGKTSATISTAVVPDVLGEGDESYSVVIDKVTSVIGGAQDPTVAIGDGTGTVTIIDDDVQLIAPNAPTGVTAAQAATLGDVDLSWTAGAANGGPPVQGYKIEVDDGSGYVAIPGSVTSTAATVACGVSGTTCTYRVRAYNSVGDSAYSSSSAPFTVPSVPGAPTGLTASVSGTFGSADLSWTAPVSDGGAAIDHYSIEVDTGSGFSSLDTTSGTSGTFLCGAAGTTCTYRVTAHNIAGDSDPSNTDQMTVPSVTLPGAPTDFAITPFDTFPDALLSWSAPTTGGSVTGYHVEYSTDGGGTYNTWDVTSDTSVYEFLPDGTTFWRIRAYNAAGDGPPSNVVGPIVIGIFG